jgi:hypothetical protein
MKIRQYKWNVVWLFLKKFKADNIPSALALKKKKQPNYMSSNEMDQAGWSDLLDQVTLNLFFLELFFYI